MPILNPLFSIITVVYNSETTIKQTIESVIRQNSELFEYIIIDGLSTDKTNDIIENYLSDIDIYISEKDNGLYDAMNKALSLSNGEYIYFLNSDDYFADDSILETIAEVIASNDKNYEIVSGAVKIDYGDQLIRYNHDCSEKNLSRGKMPPHQGLFIKKSIMIKNKGFNVEYSSSSDFDLLVRIMKSKPFVKTIPHLIAIMRTGGISSNKLLSYTERFNIIKYEYSFILGIRYYLIKVIIEQGFKSIIHMIFPNNIFKKIKMLYMTIIGLKNGYHVENKGNKNVGR
jgi:glycosyltransferase involved in cell wall biosynthesis